MSKYCVYEIPATRSSHQEILVEQFWQVLWGKGAGRARGQGGSLGVLLSRTEFKKSHKEKK